jgi:hypothetical protein
VYQAVLLECRGTRINEVDVGPTQSNFWMLGQPKHSLDVGPTQASFKALGRLQWIAELRSPANPMSSRNTGVDVGQNSGVDVGPNPAGSSAAGNHEAGCWPKSYWGVLQAGVGQSLGVATSEYQSIKGRLLKRATVLTMGPSWHTAVAQPNFVWMHNMGSIASGNIPIQFPTAFGFGSPSLLNDEGESAAAADNLFSLFRPTCRFPLFLTLLHMLYFPPHFPADFRWTSTACSV